MRRLLVFAMILSLLSVPAMPVQAEAPACRYAMPQAPECGTCDPVTQPAVHASGAQLRGQDRIECGCGCHRDVDGLPHVLDAFSPMRFGMDVPLISQHAPRTAAPARSLQVDRLQRPPPRTLS